MGIRVDLYTDAGLKDRVGTWATVAIVPGLSEPIEASGRLRADVHCTSTAELRAIANAVHKLIRRGIIGKGDEVRVYADNKSAIDRIERRHVKRPESTMAKATALIHKLGEVHGVTIRAQWVPGHKPDSHSPHAKWNNRCDALCRLARSKPAPTKARKALEFARRVSKWSGDRPFAPVDAVPVAREKLKLVRDR